MYEADPTNARYNSLQLQCYEQRKALQNAYDRIEELELKLVSANERIKRLEDRIHRAAMAFFEDVPDASVASGMLAILEEERS